MSLPTHDYLDDYNRPCWRLDTIAAYLPDFINEISYSHESATVTGLNPVIGANNLKRIAILAASSQTHQDAAHDHQSRVNQYPSS